LTFFCLPILLLGLVLDVIFWGIFRQFFDACHGLLCLTN
jgi:hypothetical protein